MLFDTPTYCLPGRPERAALDQIQQTITAVLAEAYRIDHLPVTASEVRGRIAALFEGRSDLEAAIAELSRPRPQVSARLVARAPLTLFDLHWLLGESALLDAAMARVEEKLLARGESMSLETRSRAGGELQKQALALFMAEEREVMRLLGEGITAQRREDADPAVLLRVWKEIDDESE